MRARGVAVIVSLAIAATGCAAVSGALSDRRQDRAISYLTATPKSSGYGELRIGMTRQQAESVLEESLAVPDTVDNDVGCVQYGTTTHAASIPLYLTFNGSGPSSKLLTISLLLKEARGELDLASLRAMVKEAVPAVRWIRPANGSVRTEASDPRPKYRLPDGHELVIDPDLGIVLGDLCLY